MIKKLYSKRSGFTLVEIVIAFAVFAIMASMICQILDLAVRARRSNTAYQRELDDQEHVLTLIEKDKENYKESQGNIKVEFTDGTKVDLPYDRLSAKPDAESDGEGLNYFLSPVDYNSDGIVNPTIEGGDVAGSNTGSQASRMDTRITGTGGIESIQIISVIKDTHTYAEGDPNAVPAGHTRYFIMCAASSGSPQTLKDEDVPYSQYRLYFYHQPASDSEDDKKASLDAAASAVEYTDEDGKTYTKDVYKAAKITKVGYLKTFSKKALLANGLQSTDIGAAVTSDLNEFNNNSNKYTIEQMGTNVVRIGSPFVKDNESNGGYGNKGSRFELGKTSKFYIEFEGDPNITVASFGHNAVAGDVTGSKKYTACPTYKDTYKTDGTPEYDVDGDPHVNIYGAFMQTRHYKD